MSRVAVLRLALLLASLGFGAAVATLILTDGVSDRPSLLATFALVIGLGWSLTGLSVWQARPGNRIGPLMVLLGFAWYASLLQQVGDSVLFTTGQFFEALYYAFFAHVLLSFPTGRLNSWLPRALVIVSYVDTTIVAGTAVLFDETGCCPENLAVVHPDTSIAAAVGESAAGVGVAITITSLVLLAHRWRRATPPARRVLGPVLWSGWAAAAAAGVNLVNGMLGDPKWRAVEVVALCAFAAVPFAFKLGLWRSRFARGDVARLVVELGEARAPGERLRDALARTLRDPSLEIAYWLPDQERYVDVDGHAYELPGDEDDRAATIVEREGRRVAALVHDRSLLESPELVDAAAAAAGLALENERLQAELRARLDELRASRARIVEATDAARRRVERDLHDGAQQRLVSVSMALGLAESRLPADPEGAARILAEAREGLAIALQELRELSQGIHPAILTERGLAAALRELAYRAPVPVDVAVGLDQRLPEKTEAAAYFVVTEAIANAAKHASPSAVHVSVTQRNGSAVIRIADDGVGGADPGNGTGLRGLVDRVEALGGRLTVTSPPGEGTTLEAEIPCAS